MRLSYTLHHPKKTPRRDLLAPGPAAAASRGCFYLPQAGRSIGQAAADFTVVNACCRSCQNSTISPPPLSPLCRFFCGFGSPGAINRGEYAAVFDPLDGSANIEAGLPCGTIFGILRTSGSTREGLKAGPGTIVLPGRRLVAAGYCLYGPSTKLVFTLGNGVFEFTLEGEGATEQQEAAGWRPEAGNSGSGSGSGGSGGASGGGLGGGNLNFVLSKSNMRIPQSGKVSFCAEYHETRKYC